MNENIEINETEQLNEAAAKETKLTFAQRLVELASIIASSIIAIMLIFTFVFRVVGVSGPSMMNTLRNGDWLLVSAFITEPERGDIVIVTQPNTFNEPIVKRVIAVGGDTIDIDFAAATVTVNGKVINEPYLATPTTDDEGGWTYPLTLEEGQVFVMGDNRQHSTDSRSADIGLIDENYILGQVMVRFSPLSSFTIFGDYDYE
ncbi:MAG: signal peptidase I [Clostridia bacterium]|nr:signal peptidase I [Clostridia bacterium]